MTELWEDLKSKVHGLLGSWASISARQLRALPLWLPGAQVSPNDTGCRNRSCRARRALPFHRCEVFIYLVCTIPILILIGLVLPLRYPHCMVVSSHCAP